MSAQLLSLNATLETDGSVRLLDAPLRLPAPARAVLIVSADRDEPNAATRAAMSEPLDDLPRFASVAELQADLES